MAAVVFAGPSLAGETPRAGIDYRPPAACGDILAAARAGAATIGLIDGVFESGRSVWHKEILWALDHGAAVAGAASMGALRAADLDRHGMAGIGRIYAMFRDGRLEDDDEVAVLHGPKALGYAPVTEAMVSIRETLRHALHARMISDGEMGALEAFAKGSFYKDRTYDALLAHCRTLGWPAERVADFQQWIRSNRRDLKRDDALELLDWIAARGEEKPAQRPKVHVGTRFWDELERFSAARDGTRR